MAFTLTLLMAIGVAALWIAWRGRTDRPRAVSVAGWSLVVLPVVIWTVRFADAGTAIALSAFVGLGLAALGGAAFLASNQDDGQRQERVRSAPPPNSDNGFREGLFILLAAGPAAGLTALLAGLATMRIASTAGWSPANATVLAYFAVPVLWTLLAVYVATDTSLRRRVGVFLSLSLVPLGVMAVTS